MVIIITGGTSNEKFQAKITIFKLRREVSLHKSPQRNRSQKRSRAFGREY